MNLLRSAALTAVPAVAVLAALGASPVIAGTHAPAHVKTQVSTHGPGGETSHFSAHLNPLPGPLSQQGSSILVTKDSRDLGIRDYTWCAQGPGHSDFKAVDPSWHYHAGDTSSSKCPAHDIRVDQAGFKYRYWKFEILGSPPRGIWVRMTGTHALYIRGRNS